MMPSQRREWTTVIIVVVLAVVLILSQKIGLKHQAHANCMAINQTNEAILNYVNQQLDRASKSLPTVGYYRNHPVELGRALSQISQQRRDAASAFKPISC